MLIDCWAGWCSPCMAKMPQLKALYERRHGDGFEVIGVNFDHNRDRAEELVKTVGLPWSEVYVPDDDRTRELWADGPGITDLPRLFLIDRGNSPLGGWARRPKRELTHYSTSRVFDVSAVKLSRGQLTRGTPSF